MLEYSNYEILIPKEPQDNQKEGSRLSPSAIEKLSYVYNEYNRNSQDIHFLDNINNQEPKEIKDIEKNAKYAARGTLVHNLQYFSQLFLRTSMLNRSIPNYEDISSTFPFKDETFYYSMLKIMDITTEDGISDNPLDNAQNFWNTWRFNGQGYSKEKHKNNVINPDEMRKIWEEKAVKNEELNDFRKNISSINKRDIDPYNTMLANEVLTIINLEFSNSRLLIPSYIDEIRVPRDITKEKIKLIDYKTGKQFKDPDFMGKIQILLMVSSLWNTMIKSTDKIKYPESSTWDAINENKLNIKLPYFPSNSFSQKKPFKVETIHRNTISEMIEHYCRSISFSYINPLTQEEIDVDFEKYGFFNKNTLNGMLGYIQDISEFYGKNKKILKHYINPKRSPFTLPEFPEQGFLDESQRKKDLAVQLAFNV